MGQLESWSTSFAAVVQMLDQHPKVKLGEPLGLRQRISLQNVHFRYAEGSQEVLHGINLEIQCGERIGLIGVTGSGKSTLVDLLMGLLPPTKGQISVDGQDLYDPTKPELLFGWKTSIAHVPQSIYLADSSIAENIAFGVPKHEIDYDRSC